jgi:hypothetical protein
MSKIGDCGAEKTLFESEIKTREDSACLSQGSQIQDGAQNGDSFLIFSGSQTPVQETLSTTQSMEIESKINLKVVNPAKKQSKKTASKKKKSFVKKLTKINQPAIDIAKSTDSEDEDEDEYNNRPITDFLTLPANFKPKTLA